MNVSYDFSDKVDVVTGDASGIGRGIATALARSGARVALLDINLEQAEEAAKECEALGSPKALAFHADITSSDDLNAARDGVLEAFGTVHFLISHAGVATVPGLKVNPFPPPIQNLPIEHWKTLYDYNLFGAVRVVHAFLDILKANQDGRLLFTSSVAAYKAGSKKPHYHSSKMALISFATAPTSPAPMLSASVCFLPITVRGLPIFSVSPVRALTREAPAVILPLTTRR